MTHDDSPVGVAEDDLRAHVDEFVDKEQTALKHFLMEEHAATGLRGHGDEHRDEVGRQARPGGIGQRHDGAVDERLYLVVAHAGDEEVVALLLDANAHAAENVGNDAQIGQRHILDADAVAHHGGHADERPHLNHVGQDAVRGAVEAVDAFDGEQVRGDAADAGTHAVEHAAELLHVGLAGSIVDGGCSLRQHSSHHDVGRAGDAGLVEQHVAAPQVVASNLVDATLGHGVEVGTQTLKAQEVSVQAPTPNLVAAGLGNDRLTHARQQRTNHHHRAPQLCTLLHKLVALQVVQVEGRGIKGVSVEC